MSQTTRKQLVSACSEHEFPIPRTMEDAAFVECVGRYALRNQMEVEMRDKAGLVHPEVAAGYTKAMKELHRLCEQSLIYFRDSIS